MKISDSSALKTISINKMYMTSAADIEIFGELKQPQLTCEFDWIFRLMMKTMCILQQYILYILMVNGDVYSLSVS